MLRKRMNGLFLIGAILAVMFNLFTLQAAPSGFVGASGDNFRLDGKVFRFGGANNYYLHYKSTLMLDDVLNNAVTMNLRVIRCWAFMNGNGQEGFVMQPSLGVYDENGFKRLDYTLQRAETLGLKLILPLVNNWDDFGGMNQYVNWTGAGSHDAFYTNSQCRQGYKNFVNYIVNRTNSLTGRKYKDSPAILAWELGNEPRCQSDPTGNTLVQWADEMSAYLKSLDPNHLVSVGDEGFFKRDGATDWFYNGGEGVDWDRLIALPNIDFGTVHLYPDHWSKSTDWGAQWIKDHAGQKKPVVLEEYGIQSDKESVYRSWCDTALQTGYAGTMFWLLTGIQDDGSLYADYDGFRVTYPSAVAEVLTAHSAAMAGDGIPTPTATTTPQPTNTPVVTPAPTSTAGDFAVSYTQNDWVGGATVSISVKNNGNVAVNGWTLQWNFSGNQKITNLWNGSYSQSGVFVTVQNAAYNGLIAANGGTVSFGFTISYSGSNPKPATFTLNGNSCGTY